MAVDDSVPTWFIVVMIFAGLMAVGTVLYALAQKLEWRNLPRTRLYRARPPDVIAAAVDAISRLDYGISHRDDQTISFTTKYLGESAGGLPVVHVVLLETDDDRTQVEVMGARVPGNYGWNAMAQAFLTALDDAVGRKTTP